MASGLSAGAKAMASSRAVGCAWRTASRNDSSDGNRAVREVFYYVREMEGDSIADVLSYVEYQPRELLERFRHQAEKALRAGSISARERQNVLDAFSASLRGYTYFES